MSFIVEDWAGNHLFKNKVFDSFEDGWEFIYSNVDNSLYDKTGKVIPRQDTNHLLGIMRSIYMEGCRDEFMTRHISSQNISDRERIVKLNDIVVTKSVNLIKNELVAYYKYREDISTMAVPQDLPILSNNN